MSSTEPAPSSGTPPSAIAPAGATAGVGPAPAPARRLWAAALAAGVAAGVAAWLGGEAIRGTFQPTQEATVGPAAAETNRQIEAGLTREAILAFGMLGGALGLALGLAGGLARRSTRAAAMAAVVGLALGVAASAGASAALVPIAHADRARLAEDLIFPLLILGGIGSAVGAAGGLAFGIGLGGRGLIVRAALGGLLGGALATVVYQVLGALAFPLAQAGSPLPLTSHTRLIARLAVALFAASGAAMLALGPAPIPRPAAPGPPPAP